MSGSAYVGGARKRKARKSKVPKSASGKLAAIRRILKCKVSKRRKSVAK